MQELIKETKEKMQLSIEAMRNKFSSIRTGRVSASAVDSIKIDYYGTPTLISQIASIVVKDAKTIVISPWEKNLISDISRAISEANIGVSPNDDEEGVKLFFPPMTSEQRTKSVKVAKTISEDFKVSIRNVRKESNDKIKKALKDKEITEDESKSQLSSIQSITNEMITALETSLTNKEKEILTI